MSDMEKTDNRLRLCRLADALLILAVVILTVIQIFRAPLGFDRCDESFYLTIPYRFVQGDVPVLHEWNFSLFSGILLTPLMRIYRLLGGTGEGIILNFRYIYVAFQTLTSVLIYLLLRRKNPLGALAAALVYLPFSPYYIMSLSYYSMGIGLLTLAGLALSNKDRSKAFTAASGLLFAGAVLCCPYLVFLYFLLAAVLVCVCLRRGNKTVLRDLLLFTSGAAILALAVFAMILPRSGIDGIIEVLPGFLDEPEHSSMTLLGQTGMFFRHLFFSRKISLITSVSAVILIAAALLDKERQRRRWIYVTAASAVTAGFILVNCKSYAYINFFMLPLCILGAVCYVTDERKDKDVFFCVYLAGWAYAYLMILSSNNFYESLTASLAVSSVASAFFAGKAAAQLISADARPKNVIAAILSGGCAVLLCAVLVVNKGSFARGTYLDFSVFPTKMLAYTVEEGPAKGLITYDNDYAKYCNTYEQAETARSAAGENVLYLTHDCYLYLADSKRAAGFSAWLSLDYEQSTLERMKTYYALNPEKKPDVLYIEKGLRDPMIFTALIDTEEFELTEEDTAYIYVRK